MPSFDEPKALLAIVPERFDLTQFDAIEISPVAEWEDKDGEIICETCENDPSRADMWSVYLHHRVERGSDFGGAECVGDFKTEEQANEFAADLQELLVAANPGREVYPLP